MRFVWGVIFSVVLVPTAVASEIDIAGGIEYFQWEEYSDSGNKYLDETGPRYFVEVVGTNRLESDWDIDFGGRFYSGTVDYDGQTQSGRPVTTDTDYNGVRTELGFTRSIPVRGNAVGEGWSIRFALGLDQWRRALRDTTLSDGTPVSGYVERYASTYAKVGATYRLEGAWALGIGAKAPFHTREEADINGDTITLTPEGQLSLFAQLDIPVNADWRIAIDFDSYRFAKSDPENGYYQPESRQDSAGIALHYRF